MQATGEVEKPTLLHPDDYGKEHPKPAWGAVGATSRTAGTRHPSVHSCYQRIWEREGSKEREVRKGKGKREKREELS
jgi:hypothetical protein